MRTGESANCYIEAVKTNALICHLLEEKLMSVNKLENRLDVKTCSNGTLKESDDSMKEKETPRGLIGSIEKNETPKSFRSLEYNETSEDLCSLVEENGTTEELSSSVEEKNEQNPLGEKVDVPSPSDDEDIVPLGPSIRPNEVVNKSYMGVTSQPIITEKRHRPSTRSLAIDLLYDNPFRAVRLNGQIHF